jgi:hypothetical protein
MKQSSCRNNGIEGSPLRAARVFSPGSFETRVAASFFCGSYRKGSDFDVVLKPTNPSHPEGFGTLMDRIGKWLWKYNCVSPMGTILEKPHRRTFHADLKSHRKIWLFVLLLPLYVNGTCFAQTVTVRIVNATNESPLKNEKVFVPGINGKEETQDEAHFKLITKPNTPDLRLVTDVKGEAQFQLPNLVPAYVYVRAELSRPLWDCTCLFRVSTEQVTQKGFIVTTYDNERSRSKTSIQPKLGEVLIRLTPTPWWERLFYPLFR